MYPTIPLPAYWLRPREIVLELDKHKHNSEELETNKATAGSGFDPTAKY